MWISGTDCDLEGTLKKEKFCFVFDHSGNKNSPLGCTFSCMHIDLIVFKSRSFNWVFLEPSVM